MGNLDPRTGVLKSYPENVKGCCGPLVQANDGKLWMLTAQINAADGITTSIGVAHFDPATGITTPFAIRPTFPAAQTLSRQLPDVAYPPSAIISGSPTANSP